MRHLKLNTKKKRDLMLRITTCFLALFLISNHAHSSNRVALVIGNSSYTNSYLPNPVNDAMDMAAELRRLNFEVSLLTDATQKNMEDAIRAFGKQLNQGSRGLFYYAGHGIQSKGQNYLLPIGSDLSIETDLRYKAVNLGMIMDQMEAARNPVNIVILDACRNNPLQRTFRSSSRGLARLSRTPTGLLLAYATSPGKLALDGTGRNGIYTKHLLEGLKFNAHLPIELMFKEILKGVKNETRGQQIPWVTASLEKDFYFTNKKTAPKKRNNFETNSSEDSFVTVFEFSSDPLKKHKYGAGFFISETGMVATRYKNIHDGGKLYAFDPKTKNFSPAVLVASDPENDIAIIGTALPARLSSEVEFTPTVGTELKSFHTSNGSIIKNTLASVDKEILSHSGQLLRISKSINDSDAIVKDKENRIVGLLATPLTINVDGGAVIVPISTIKKLVPKINITSSNRTKELATFKRLLKAPITKEDQKLAEDWLDKSIDAFDDGSWFEVIRTSDVVLRYNPGSLSAYLNRSGAYINLNFIDKAKADLEKAIIINPSAPIALFNWSIIYQREGKLKASLDYLKRSCTGSFEVACAKLEKMAGHTPDTESQWYQTKALDFFNYGNYHLSTAFASRAIEVNANYAAPYITRSAAMTTLNQPEFGLKDAEKAIQLAPDAAVAYNNKGFALERLGKSIDAYIEYQKGCVIEEKKNPSFIACKNSARIKP